MSVINIPLSDFFAEAGLILNNAQTQPQIAAALAALGYDALTLQAGQALLDTALALYDTQITEYGEQHAATQTFTEATAQADKNYATHRSLAKIAFKNDPQRQTDLHLNDAKPRAFHFWYAQARHFYTALVADAEAQTQLARFNLTLIKLQETQAQVEQTFSLNNIQEQEKGEAQAATEERNIAIKELDEWLSDFRTIARIALTDTPQLLEALYIGAPSLYT